MVYIDNFYVCYGKWRGMNMCHMVADDTTELLLFAAAIGLKLEWIQKPGHPIQEHFDISLSKKQLALALGAQDVTWRELGAIIQKRSKIMKNSASLSPIPKFTAKQVEGLNAVLARQGVGYMIEGDGKMVSLLLKHWKYLDVRKAPRVPLFKSKEKFKAVYIYGKLKSP